MRPAAEIEACRASHRRLLDGLASLAEPRFREPSRLPGWSRAHVVAHVATKAEAHRVLFAAAGAGIVARVHPEGFDPDAAAAQRSERSPVVLVDDVARAFTALEEAWDDLDDDRWDHRQVMMAGPRPMATIVEHHLRNVEVHHVDLDIGYEPADWPKTFVDGELARRLRDLPRRAGPPDLLRWLLDRGPAPELDPW